MRAIKYRRGTYYRNHQKARGGKRHLVRLRKASITPVSLDAETLSAYGSYHEKLGLHPWHWHHRQPPQLVRQLAAGHLLTTFFEWLRQLRAQPEPFYLAVWLVKGSEFAHSSQVVAGISEKRGRYRDVYQAPDPAGPPLPPEYRQLPGADKLTWMTHPWEIGLDSVDYPHGWPAWALAKPHSTHVYEDDSTYLLVQTGWVWVGQLAATPGSAT